MLACEAVGDGAHMREFWDARARENALYFVDSTLDYRSPDTGRFWREGKEALEGVLSLLQVTLRPTDHVVEIGCGVGRMTRALAERVRRVTAIDVSPEMLARARELNPGAESVSWLQGDGVSLAGVPDSEADACMSFVVFQHIPQPAITLGYVREMGRILRPGAWAAFQVSNDPDLHRPSGARRRVATLLGRSPRGRRDPAWLGSAIDLSELSATAQEVGMTVERVHGEGTQFCLVLLQKRPT